MRKKSHTSRSGRSMRSLRNVKDVKVFAFPDSVWKTSGWRRRKKGTKKQRGKAFPLSARKPRRVVVAQKIEPIKPSKPVLPRDVMEERIISISSTHLSPMAQQRLQYNLRKADDQRVREVYETWSKKGKKKPIKPSYQIIVGETVDVGVSFSNLKDAEKEMQNIRKEKPSVRRMKIVKTENGQVTDVEKEKVKKIKKLPSDKEVIGEVENLQKQNNYVFVSRKEVLNQFSSYDGIALTNRIDALVKAGKLEETSEGRHKKSYLGLPSKPWPKKEGKRTKIPKKKKVLSKMTHIEKMHLLASCKQFDIDPQEIDNTLTYSENKRHIHEMAKAKGVSEWQITSSEKEADQWASQYEGYLSQLRTELESAGYEVKGP